VDGGGGARPPGRRPRRLKSAGEIAPGEYVTFGFPNEVAVREGVEHRMSRPS
jgi:hypothetical protein